VATINTNTTSTLSGEDKTFYDRTLLAHAKVDLVFYEHGQKRPLPKHEGTTISWRRFTPWDAATTALTEGTNPDGTAMALTTVSGQIAQYGRYTAISDKLQYISIDPLIVEAIELCGENAGLTVDHLTRDAMLASTNIHYANSKTAIYLLAATDEINTTEVRKVRRTLRKNKARMFRRGGKKYYIAIVSPDSTFDLQADSKWEAVSTYSAHEQIFSGELGRIYGVMFIESTEAKVYENQELIDGATQLTAASLSTLVVTVDEAITTAEAAALVSREINVVDITDGTTYNRTTITAAAAGAAGSATVTVADATTGFTIADGDILYAQEYGVLDGSNDVHATMIFGRDSYGVVDLEGENLETIVHDKSIAGGALELYSTVGWKANGYVAKVLNNDWIVKMLHGVTA